MAKTTTQPMSPFAMGEDTESALANQAYKEAMDKLLQTYEARNEKPFFDPKMLSLAQAFSKPTQTGDFFESLGNVAASLGASQEAEQKKVEDLARMRLELAGMGVQQANQQATTRELARRSGIGGYAPPSASEEPAGATSGGLSGAPSGVLSGNLSGNLSGQPAGTPSAPSPFGDMEPIGQYPVNPNLIKTPQEFYKRAMQGGERDIAAIEKGWTAYQKDFLAPKFEGGNVYDPTTGYMYSKNTGETATATFMTDGENYSIPKSAVIEHQRLLTDARKNPDNPEVFKKIDAFENFWSKGPTRTGAVPKPELAARPYSIEAQEQARVAPSVAPSAVPPAQPAAPAGGIMSAEARERKKAKEASELAVQQAIAIEEGKAKVGAGAGAEAKRREVIGAEVGKLAVAEETKLAQNAENAGKLFTAADTVVKAVKKSPDYFGVFNKPGVLNAIGATVAEAARPGGRFTIIDVEQKVLQLMPGTTKENLLDREKAASALSEIELGYTMTYLAKQGAVTEGERKIVRAIPGGLSSSPKFLEFKGKLIRERAQYDMDLNTAYNEYLRVKPNGDALDFKRNSPLYKEIHNDFERKTAGLANTIPALTTKERPKQEDAGSYAADLLKRRMQQ